MNNSTASLHEKHSGRPSLPPVINELKYTIPALSVNEGFARACSGAFIALLDPTATELSDIKCALSEAVTNCIVHAYRGTDTGKCLIHIIIRLREDRSVYIEIRDTGCGIADIGKARTPLFTTDAAGERSGMGFTVMESFMDKISVVSKPGKGTTVKMTKRLRAGRKI